jgi:small subunit ribosomal protein S1
MFNKQSISENEINIPDFIDEGWWNAVLTDVETIQYSKIGVSERTMDEETFQVDWVKVQKLYELDEVIDLQVNGFNRGGVLVRGDGLQGFVPISHLIKFDKVVESENRDQHLAAYLDVVLRLKIIEFEPEEERIVFSERAALAGGGKRKQIFNSLTNGDNIRGTVTNVTDFGVFVDLGGVEGLIHLSELSWGRVQHPSSILKPGDSIEALVLKVDEESSRVALSYKRLFPNPWESLIKQYNPGDIISATITSVVKYGAFARLKEGIEGLIHVSSMGNNLGIKSVMQLMKPGIQVQVQILHIDSSHRRLGLGLVKIEESG